LISATVAAAAAAGQQQQQGSSHDWHSAVGGAFRPPQAVHKGSTHKQYTLLVMSHMHVTGHTPGQVAADFGSVTDVMPGHLCILVLLLLPDEQVDEDKQGANRCQPHQHCHVSLLYNSQRVTAAVMASSTLQQHSSALTFCMKEQPP
jgi:hypothetical protein